MKQFFYPNPNHNHNPNRTPNPNQFVCAIIITGLPEILKLLPRMLEKVFARILTAEQEDRKIVDYDIDIKIEKTRSRCRVEDADESDFS